VQVTNPVPNAENLSRREIARVIFQERYLKVFQERLPRYPYATDDPRQGMRPRRKEKALELGSGKRGRGRGPYSLPPFFPGPLSAILTPMVFQKRGVPLRAIRPFLGLTWRPGYASTTPSGPLRRPFACSRRGR